MIEMKPGALKARIDLTCSITLLACAAIIALVG